MKEEEIMLTHLLKCSRTDLLTQKVHLNPEQAARLTEMKKRRLAHEPLQYILQETDFMGRIFKVSEDVLIPRPETEIMMEAAIVKAKVMLKERQKRKDTALLKILDIGTGSGNIAVTLASEIGACEVTAIDVSYDALNMARQNARCHSVSDKICFIEEDMNVFFQDKIEEECKYDLIISNPPYIETETITSLQKEVQFEPKVALDGGKRGLDFCLEILVKGEDCLSENGVLLMEIGDGQRVDVERFFGQIPTSRQISFIKDYRQTDRIVVIESNDYF